MTQIKAYATMGAKEQLGPFDINRRSPGKNDVAIDITYCGVCHSDIHQARNEWGVAVYPLVPGHEIVGIVSEVGAEVKRFKKGDRVGVGCFVDSCRTCAACKQDLEQYCEVGMVQTYNHPINEGKERTYGGYSKHIVVDENYVLSIPNNLDFAAAAPLLCAGITTYSPLRYCKIKSGDQVAVMGLGGLGHMAVKLAAAMGAEVTVISTSDKKKDDALKLGAKHFINSKSADFAKVQNHFDLMINTVSANIKLDDYINLLKLNGTMVLVGAPEKPYDLNVFPLLAKRRAIIGSLIGGIQETQEMLDFCGKHNIASDIELIPMQKINEAYERMIKGDVRYRFVIDMKTL